MFGLDMKKRNADPNDQGAIGGIPVGMMAGQVHAYLKMERRW